MKRQALCHKRAWKHETLSKYAEREQVPTAPQSFTRCDMSELLRSAKQRTIDKWKFNDLENNRKIII